MDQCRFLRFWYRAFEKWKILDVLFQTRRFKYLISKRNAKKIWFRNYHRGRVKIFANLNILLEIIIIHLSFSNRKFFQNKKKKETQIAYLLAFENISSFKGIQLYDTIKSNKKKKNENNYSSRLKSSLLTRKKKKKNRKSLHPYIVKENIRIIWKIERLNGWMGSFYSSTESISLPTTAGLS